MQIRLLSIQLQTNLTTSISIFKIQAVYPLVLATISEEMEQPVRKLTEHVMAFNTMTTLLVERQLQRLTQMVGAT